MKRNGIIWVIFIFIILPVFNPALADSSKSHQDYLYQLDQYRTKYNDFKIAKNEYDKFNTLTSQATALDKTKSMLIQRDILLRTYLLFLNDKINENAGLSAPDRTLYMTLINNEVTFLNTHSQLTQAIATINDSVGVSGQMTDHYMVLQSSVSQIVIGLEMGNLNILAAQYDNMTTQLTAFIQANRGQMDASKQTIIDRWMVSIKDKRELYQEKYDSVATANAKLHGDSLAGLTQQSAVLKNSVNEAREYLLEGSSYMGELLNVIKSKS
jgi:hypothetical protein